MNSAPQGEHSTPPTVLILAGGFATRLWPLTERRAKPLLPLAGKPLIQHIIDALPEDFPVIISTNAAFADDFGGLKALYPERDVQVFVEDSSHDRTKVGALAATALVIEEFGLQDPLMLVAGDNYFGFDVQDFLAAYEGRTLLASFDTQSLQAAKQFGVVVAEGKKLVDFMEKPLEPTSTLISTGCYLFQPEHLPEIIEYSRTAADNLGGIFEHLMKKNAEIDVFSFEEDWIDIGSFDSYLKAHQQLQKENRLHQDSELINVTIGKAVDIAEGCLIEDSELEDVIVMSGTTIKSCRLRGCIIDENCVLEHVDLTGKMIRAGSVIRGKQ